MIRIQKPTAMPKSLAVEGAARRVEHEAAYDAGATTFEFDRTIYAHRSVREALAVAQHGKCCFCERKIEDADVEHFRPKSAFRQARNAPLEQPGYYWLAYTWSNLYLACRPCNQRNKQSLFPLLDPDARVRSHHDAERLEQELPMFIDPGCENPEQRIGFRDGEPYPIDDDARARATIQALELGRTFLMEQRSAWFQMLDLLFRELTEGELREDIASLLAARTRDEAEFTAVTRSFLREQLGPDAPMPIEASELLARATTS